MILDCMSFYGRSSAWPGEPPARTGLIATLAMLFDTRLERRCGPLLVRWLYIALLTMIASVTVFGMLMSWWLASWAGWGFWMGVPISVAGGLVWALGARLMCEQLIRWTGPVLPRNARTTAVHAEDRYRPIPRGGR